MKEIKVESSGLVVCWTMTTTGLRFAAMEADGPRESVHARPPLPQPLCRRGIAAPRRT